MLNELPFDTFGMAGDDERTLLNVCNQIMSKRPILFTDKIQEEDLLDFSLFNDCRANVITTIEQANGNPGAVLAMCKSSKSYAGKGSKIYYDDYQLWGYIKLKRDFGRVIIRKETLIDKLMELLHHTELKFDEDNEFNQSFYVLANDTLKATLAMNWNFRSALMNIEQKDFVIEILNNALIIGNFKPMDHPDSITLFDAVEIIASA